jgi:hypothetical protein
MIMEKVSRQQKQKLHRELCDNKWYVKDWQAMKFMRTGNDFTGTGQLTYMPTISIHV